MLFRLFLNACGKNFELKNNEHKKKINAQIKV